MVSTFRLNTLYKFMLQFIERYNQTKLNLEEEAKQSNLLIKYKISTTYDEYLKTGKLVVQCKRGGAYSVLTPQQICDDEMIISHLHPIDVSIVTRLQVDTGRNTNTSAIIKQRFSEEDGETIYLIYDSISNKACEISENNLLDATHIVNRLNVKDCMSIGFGMGVQYSKRVAAIK